MFRAGHVSAPWMLLNDLKLLFYWCPLLPHWRPLTGAGCCGAPITLKKRRPGSWLGRHRQ